jgi:hypothetical protein
MRCFFFHSNRLVGVGDGFLYFYLCSFVGLAYDIMALILLGSVDFTHYALSRC